MADFPLQRRTSGSRRRWLLPVVAIALLACMPAVPPAAPAQQVPAAGPAQYRPGLGDLMTFTVQPRHVKLGLAGRENNWPYASYELHELQEAFQRAAAVWPNWRGFAIGDMIRSTVAEPIGQLEEAIKAADPGRYAAAYSRLTAACNTCHQSAGREVIVMQEPASSPFPDQDFRPRAR